MVSSNDKRTRLDQVSRRKFLQAGIGAGTIFLSGCSSTNGGSTTTNGGSTTTNGGSTTTNGGSTTTNGGSTTTNGGSTTTNGGSTTTKENSSKTGKPIENVYDDYTGIVPTNVQFNPFNPKNWNGIFMRYLYDPFAIYNYQKHKYQGYVLSDWSIDSGKLTLSLHDGYTWHNGDALTAEDLVTQFRISKYLNDPLWDYFKEVKIVDKHTVEASVSSVSPNIIYAQLFDPERYVYAPASRYKKWLRKIDDGTPDKVIQNLLKYAPNDPLGNGPVELTERSNQQAIFKWYDDYPLTDSPNFDKVRLRLKQGNQAKWAAIKGDILDACATYMPSSVLKTLPDNIRMKTAPNYGGSGLAFNQDRDHVSNINVRKAIAYLINRDKTAKTIYAPVSESVTHLTGLPNSINKQTIPNIIDKIEQYQSDPNPDKAAQYLKKGGYNKKNGMWKKDGKPLQFNILVASGTSNQVAGYKALTGTLSNFGMDVNLKTVDNTTFTGDRWPNSKFDAAQNYWGDRIPYKSEQQYFTGGQGTMANAMNMPDEFEIPNKFGSIESSKQTTKPAKLLKKLQTAKTDQQNSESLKKLVWLFNQTLPIIPIAQKKLQSFHDTKHWTIPPNNSPKISKGGYWPEQFMLRDGTLQAKEK